MTPGTRETVSVDDQNSRAATVEELDRVRVQADTDHRSNAAGLANLAKYVGEIEGPLRRIAHYFDGDAIGNSLPERIERFVNLTQSNRNDLASLKQELKDLSSDVRELQDARLEVKQRLTYLETQSVEKRTVVRLVGLAIFAAVLSAVGSIAVQLIIYVVTKR